MGKQQRRDNVAINEEGWKIVSYKKKGRFTDEKQGITRQYRHTSSGGTNQGPVKRRFLAQEVKQEYERAFKEGRCFRCLSRNHKQIQCREPLRCFKCKGIGHKYGGCKLPEKARENQPIKNNQSARKVEPKITYAQVVKQTDQRHPVAEKDKGKKTQSTEGVSMDDLWHECPEESHVYVSDHQELLPENRYLRHTGMIVMTEGHAQPDLLGLFARRLARQFGGQPFQYEVYTGNPEDDASFVLICQSIFMLQQIIWNSPYTLRRGTQVGVMPWNMDWNMVYEPSPFQAWVRLVNMPLHAWNLRGIRKVATELGRVTAVLPFGREARHFRHVTVRLDCEDPIQFSRFLKFHQGPRCARIRVVLLHWRPWQDTPYPIQIQQIPPEQNPWGNPAPIPPPQPEYTDSDNSNEDSGGSSSGGSDVLIGQAPPVQEQPVQLKRGRTWKIKHKVKRMLKKRNKKAHTQRATQEEVQDLEDNKTADNESKGYTLTVELKRT